MDITNSLPYGEENINAAEKDGTGFKNNIPLLNELFCIHKKVGEGTFSSVFLATLKSSSNKKKFALKYLIPTCHPERIKSELKCLQQIGGQDHVVNLELCLRNEGSVVFVMPFIAHDKFSDYVQDMSVQETKDYMKALFVALRRVHKFNIIHRDVKPSNFLYDRSNKRYLLVDFGLAQRFVVKIDSTDHGFKDVKIQSMKRKRSDENNSKSILYKNISRYIGDQCSCYGKPKVCLACLNRPSQIAARAGTPGFRAPEVLLKHPSQTPAIDIWASGVIMLCILSGTQPFFHSPDDCTALAEITSIFGSQRIQQCAQKLGKKLIISENIPEIDIMSLCQKLQKRNTSMPQNINYNKKAQLITQYPKEAYQLLTNLLDLDYKTRITADQALNHPFLNS